MILPCKSYAFELQKHSFQNTISNPLIIKDMRIGKNIIDIFSYRYSTSNHNSWPKGKTYTPASVGVFLFFAAMFLNA